MTDQLIQPADVEQAVIDELTPDFVIGTSLPQTLPPLFVRVVAVGGTPETLVSDSFLVVVEVFALRESLAVTSAANILARLDLARRKGRMGSETCYGLGVMGLPQNYPLPSVPSHKRYLMTLAPVLRRRVTNI